jgi:hypothetical protein
MRSRLSFLLILGALSICLSCKPIGSLPPTRLCYASSDGLVRSTLVSTQARGAERLVAVTELASGARLVEDVKLDESGRVIEATATLAATEKRGAIRVALNPGDGSVQVNTDTFRTVGTVPNDLPWVWAPLLTEPSTGAPIATPLEAYLVFRAAASARPVRLLDLGALDSHTVTADQLVVRDGDRATVILGDDAADFDGGVPRRLYLTAFGAKLEPMKSDKPPTVLAAALSCKAPSGSFLP